MSRLWRIVWNVRQFLLKTEDECCDFSYCLYYEWTGLFFTRQRGTEEKQQKGRVKKLLLFFFLFLLPPQIRKCVRQNFQVCFLKRDFSHTVLFQSTGNWRIKTEMLRHFVCQQDGVAPPDWTSAWIPLRRQVNKMALFMHVESNISPETEEREVVNRGRKRSWCRLSADWLAR